MIAAFSVVNRSRGFTLIELVITLALVGVVAMTALPLYDVSATRSKELELRAALRTIRTAIDAYKAASDSGQVPKGATESGYPPSLETLVRGVDAARDTINGGRRTVFLRQIPRDPFATDPAAPAEQHWATRTYGAAPDDLRGGDDVFDVASRSTRVGSNGVPYREW
jgi:general secretion pathway protein G